MESLIQEKTYWDKRDQELWNRVNPKSNEELLNLIQEYWADLSGDNEFYFAIQTLRQRLKLPLDKEYFGSTWKELKDGGWPDKDIVEVII